MHGKGPQAKRAHLFSGGEGLDQLLNGARAMRVQGHLDQLLLLCSLLQHLHKKATLRPELSVVNMCSVRATLPIPPTIVHCKQPGSRGTTLERSEAHNFAQI